MTDPSPVRDHDILKRVVKIIPYERSFEFAEVFNTANGLPRDLGHDERP